MNNDELNKLIKAKVIPALRRVSRWWGPKTSALRKQKVSPGKYRCEICKDIFNQKDVSLDHKVPVVSVKEGFQGWEIYISRMFCDENGFQVLCKDGCHAQKTQVENEMRKKYRKKKTKKKK